MWMHAAHTGVRGGYDPYGDANSILGKYDEEKGRSTITLDGGGGVDEAKAKKLAAIKARLQATQAGAGGGSGAKAYDLTEGGGAAAAPRPGLADGDDYQSKEEAAAFKKPGGGKGKKKLRKKVRSLLAHAVIYQSTIAISMRHRSIISPHISQAKAEKLDLDELEAAATAEGGADRGSRCGT